MSLLNLLRETSAAPEEADVRAVGGWPDPSTDFVPSVAHPWPAQAPYPATMIGDLPFFTRFSVFVESRSDGAKMACFLLYELPDGEKRVVYRGGYTVLGEWDDAERWVFSLRPRDWWKRHALYRLSMSLSTTEAKARRDASPGDDRGRDPIQNPTPEDRELYYDFARASLQVPTTRRRDRITDSVLQEVADVYRRAWRDGMNPTQEVGKHFRKSPPTASRWVSLARRAGYLGKPDSTRGGEVDDD